MELIVKVKLEDKQVEELANLIASKINSFGSNSCENNEVKKDVKANDISFIQEDTDAKYEKLPPEFLKQQISIARNHGVNIGQIKDVLIKYGYEKTSQIPPEKVPEVANAIMELFDGKC